MSINVFRAFQEASLWDQHLNRLPLEMQDIYFTHEYVSMNILNDNSDAALFVYQENNSYWLHTFIISKVRNDLLDNHEKYYDIETPYGYGGPIANTKNKSFLINAQKQFFIWCKQHSIIAEFVRFHPLLGNYRFYNMLDEIKFNRKTISNDLTNIDEDSAYDTKTRNMLRKFRKSNLKIIKTKSKDLFYNFVKLYKETIEKKEVSNFYFFSDLYFKNLFKLVESSGWLLYCKNIQNEMVGGAVVLKGSNLLHYHLAASKKDSIYAGLGNAIIHEAALLAKSLSCQKLHLGGGNTDSLEDNLFKFKKKMGNSENDFFIGNKINNHDVYNKMKKRWIENNEEANVKNRILFYK